MKLKGEFKLDIEEAGFMPDVKRTVCRILLRDMIEHMTTEQMEALLNLQELDPREATGFVSSDHQEAKRLSELRDRLLQEHCVLYRATIDLNL